MPSRRIWTSWLPWALLAGLLAACGGLSWPGAQPTTPPAAATAAANDTTPPQVTPEPPGTNPVFYGRQGCGPVTLTLAVTAHDDSGQVAVAVKYWLVNAQGQTSAPQVAPLQPQGNDRYAVTLAPAAQAQAFLQGQEGTLAFQFIANDAAGNQTLVPATAPTRGTVPLKPCNQGAAVPSPSARPPASGAQVRITQVSLTPQRAFYGRQCTATEPGEFTLAVQVDRPQDVQQVVVYFEYGHRAAGQPQLRQALLLSEQGNGRYRVAVGVADYLAASDTYDTLYYQVVAFLHDGRTVSSPVQTAELRNCTPPAAGNPPSTGPIIIDDVRSGEDPLYYGQGCGAGQPIQTQITASIEPREAVEWATLYFGWTPNPQGLPVVRFPIPMYQLGIGDFAADIDTTPFDGVVSGDGYLMIEIEVKGKDGQMYYTTHPVIVAQVKECATYVVQPTIHFFRSEHANDTVGAGEQIYLSWDTENALCGVYLNGQLVTEDASFYPVEVAQTPGAVLTYTLEAYNGDCGAMPDVATATVQVTVADAIVGPPLQGCLGSESLTVGPNLPQVDMDVDCDGVDDLRFSWSLDILAGREMVSVVTLNAAQVADGWAGAGPQDCRTTVAQAAQSGQDVSWTELVTGLTVCYVTGTDQAGVLTVDVLDPQASGDYTVQYTYQTEFVNP